MTDLVIATGRIHDPKLLGRTVVDDLLLVPIVRSGPRGMPHLVPSFLPLAPSGRLFGRYRAGGMSWADYTAAYLREIGKHDGPAIVDTLHSMAASHDCEGVILMCFCDLAKDRCHRTLAAGWIHQETDIWVEEVSKAARPPAAEPKDVQGRLL